MNPAPTVDVFTAEIIRNGLTACAYEMSKTLARTAHSTLLYDVQDFGVGILGADGAVWGETPGITIFTGCLPEVIKSALRKYGRDGFADGDVPLPPHWGGFRIVPDEFEFWQGRPNRLHDRLRYERTSDGWAVSRLSP